MPSSKSHLNLPKIGSLVVTDLADAKAKRTTEKRAGKHSKLHESFDHGIGRDCSTPNDASCKSRFQKHVRSWGHAVVQEYPCQIEAYSIDAPNREPWTELGCRRDMPGCASTIFVRDAVTMMWVITMGPSLSFGMAPDAVSPYRTISDREESCF